MIQKEKLIHFLVFIIAKNVISKAFHMLGALFAVFNSHNNPAN